MSQIKRARTAEARRRRERELLQAAMSIEAESGFIQMGMAAVARRAGVAKGTVFLYFPTKEALGLAMLEAALDGWFVELGGAGGERRDVRRLARWLAGTVAKRPVLARMLPLLGSVLDRNVPVDRAVGFRERLLGRMRHAGAALERTAPYLARGDGLQLQLFVFVLVTGLQPLAEPPAAMEEALKAPELAALRLDFQGSLESALRVHLEGLRALRAGDADGAARPQTTRTV